MPILLPTGSAFWRIAAALLLAATTHDLLQHCLCLQLPWPTNDHPSPFTLRSWHRVQLACAGPAPGDACTDALIRVSGFERPVAMLVASAAWRHDNGDIYGSAHSLLGALQLLHNSSRSSIRSSSSAAVNTTALYREILGILHRVMDLNARSASSPSTLYPAQITPFSEFANALLSICRSLPAMRVVIEVGSGAGAGSSSAVIGGALRRPPSNDLRVFLIELGAERCARLAQRYAHLPFVRVIAASATPLSAFPSAAEVAAAHAEWRDAEFSLTDALKWRQQDWTDLQAPSTVHDGISSALAAARRAGAAAAGRGGGQLPGDPVDVAVLDGSEFTGWQELALIYGARVIALDDTRTLKHRRSRALLLGSGCYTAVADTLHERNGWAIFARVPGSTCAAFA
jgi:hypothetical protein